MLIFPARPFPYNILKVDNIMTQKPVSFRAMVDQFPEIELPITLGSETHHIFSKENKPLSKSHIITYLVDQDKSLLSEFAEFVSCFRIPMANDIVGLVVWKADLLTYEYHLFTFDQKGNRIASHVIAGTKTDGETILQRAATIEDDGLILIAEGKSPVDARHFDAEASRTFQLEILSTGDIIHSLQED